MSDAIEKRMQSELDRCARRVRILERDIEYTVTAWKNSEHGNFEHGMARLERRLEER